MLPDHLILKFYRHDIINQLQGISEEFEKLGKELDKKRLSKKVREAKLDRYYRISDLGNKKLAMLKELDNATK